MKKSKKRTKSKRQKERDMVRSAKRIHKELDEQFINKLNE